MPKSVPVVHYTPVRKITINLNPQGRSKEEWVAWVERLAELLPKTLRQLAQEPEPQSSRFDMTLGMPCGLPRSATSRNQKTGDEA